MPTPPSMERYLSPVPSKSPTAARLNATGPDLTQAHASSAMELARKVSWGVGGGETGHHAFDEGVEFFAFFGRHDEDLAGEAVAQGVVLYSVFGLG